MNRLPSKSVEDFVGASKSVFPDRLRNLSHASAGGEGADGRASSYNSSLLSPPVTPGLSEKPPFQPESDDNVSLSMKKKHNHGRPGYIAAARSDLGVDPISQTPTSALSLTRTHSLPNLKLDSPPQLRREKSTVLQSRLSWGTQVIDSRRSSLPRRPRRWTTPTKGAASCAPASTVPAFIPPSRTLTDRSLPTPAIISLRRATTLNARRPTVYTSFPDPKFTTRKTGFLANIWPQNDSTKDIPKVQVTMSRRASILDARVHPSMATLVPAVCTEVTLNAATSWAEGLPPRRCSTRYVSRNSIYEVLWDEDVTPGDSGSGSRPEASRISSQNSNKVNVSSDMPRRRHSSAMDKLEEQLAKARQQSLSKSPASAPEPRRSPSAAFDLAKLIRGVSFKDRSQSAGLHELPRSRAWTFRTRSNSKTEHIDTEALLQSSFETNEMFQAVNYFPPLKSRLSSVPTTVPESPVEEMIRAERNTWEHPGPSTVVTDVSIRTPKRPPGSFLGSSTHQRKSSSHISRRSSAVVEQNKPESSDGTAAFRRRMTNRWVHGDDEEHQPLLAVPIEMQG